MKETRDSDADSDEDVTMEDGPDPFEVSTTTGVSQDSNVFSNKTATDELCTSQLQFGSNSENHDENSLREGSYARQWPSCENRDFHKAKAQSDHVVFTPEQIEQHFLGPSNSNNSLIHPTPFYFERNISSLMSKDTMHTARLSLSFHGRTAVPGLPLYVPQTHLISPQARTRLFQISPFILFVRQ